MLARLKDLSFDRDGNQIITLVTRQDCRSLFDEMNENDIDVEIKKHRKKRSLDANAYFWVLCDRLSVATGIPKKELYREYVKNIGGNCYHGCFKDSEIDSVLSDWERNGLGWITETMESQIDGCTVAVLFYGSSQYDNSQMSRLIDFVVEDCKDNNIETMTPDELARIKEEWK